MTPPSHAHRPTVADIRKGYDERKRAFDRQFILSPLFRSMSFYPTALFARLHVSPSQATWFSLVIGLGGSALLATGGYSWTLAGAICVGLWFLLDYVDGNLARYLERSSLYGKFLDDLVGELVEVSVLLCVGVGLYRHRVDSLGLGPDPGVYLAAGAIAALSRVLTASFNTKFRGEFASVGETRPQTAPASGRPPLLVLVHANVTSFAGLVVPILVLAAIGGVTDVFLLFYATAYAFTLLSTLTNLLRKAHVQGRPSH